MTEGRGGEEGGGGLEGENAAVTEGRSQREEEENEGQQRWTREEESGSLMRSEGSDRKQEGKKGFERSEMGRRRKEDAATRSSLPSLSPSFPRPLRDTLDYPEPYITPWSIQKDRHLRGGEGRGGGRKGEGERERKVKGGSSSKSTLSSGALGKNGQGEKRVPFPAFSRSISRSSADFPETFNEI